MYLHVHVTRIWLLHTAAPDDLIRRAAFLALRLAQERDEVTGLSIAQFGVIDVLLAGGEFRLGQVQLNSLTLPPVMVRTAGLVAAVAAAHAVAATLDDRLGDAAVPMDAAAELAERFGAIGEIDSLGFLYGPTEAAVYRMWIALEAGEPDRAVNIAQDVDEHYPFAAIRAPYWSYYGQALAQLPHRHNDAVLALRTAERIFPTKILRDPVVRNTLAGLMNHSIRGAAGDELREMARRAGLPV